VDTQTSSDGRHRHYKVRGQLFFASAEDFLKSIDFNEVAEKVTIDLSDAHIWDISSISALDTVVLRLRRDGAEVEVIGLNVASQTIVDKLALHDREEHSADLAVK
jgi:SulP family sulfate permease